MAVVEESMSTLEHEPDQRACFLEKLSATGRGQQDLEPTADESRRVIFRIHVKAHEEHTIERKVM